jgi:hypothetical protein
MEDSKITRNGVLVLQHTCPTCGKELDDFRDAIKAQKAGLKGKK